MLEILGLSLSIALGIILAGVIIIILLLNPLIMRLYTKIGMKCMDNILDNFSKDEDQ